MSEATKLWTVEVRGEWVTMIEPGGVIWLEFHVGDNSITEDKVREMVRAMNMHDGLVAVAEKAMVDSDRTMRVHHGNVKNRECQCGCIAWNKQLKSALAGEPTGNTNTGDKDEKESRTGNSTGGTGSRGRSVRGRHRNPATVSD